MRDFTLNKYRQLLLTLRQAGYTFMPVEQYADHASDGRTVILRHDVDAHPERALSMAQLEHELGIRATYYFRAPEMYTDPVTPFLQGVRDLGHEIGYHYEDLVLSQGTVDKAYDHFCHTLHTLRTFYPVRTIAAHGSPRSDIDSKDLWLHYDYRLLGIVCEPYLDIDYRRVLYLTDTGRRWDGWTVSLRDKIPHAQQTWTDQGLVFHTTDDILLSVETSHKKGRCPKGGGAFPPCLLLSTHPQRWTDNTATWLRELITQNAKNAVKRLLVREAK